LIDNAKGGVFLVEGISRFDPETRAMLLGLTEAGSFRRKGSTSSTEADAQVVLTDSSPPPDVQEAIARSKGVVIAVPPLRAHAEDIQLLSQYFLQRLYRRGLTSCRSFRSEAMDRMEAHAWPGNVRELKAAIEYAAVLAGSSGRTEIDIEHLPMGLPAMPPAGLPSATGLDYQYNMARAELALVENVISRFNITKQVDIARTLRYQNRFILSRHIRDKLTKYPTLGTEFPGIARRFQHRRQSP
jgi:DNA-binding NtrC family response regulator